MVVDPSDLNVDITWNHDQVETSRYGLTPRKDIAQKLGLPLAEVRSIERKALKKIGPIMRKLR